jgi:hypothetical protein
VAKCGCSTSTGICGRITRGYGKLDANGYWEHECPHGNAYEDYEPKPAAVATGCHHHHEPCGVPFWLPMSMFGLIAVLLLVLLATHPELRHFSQ